MEGNDVEIIYDINFSRLVFGSMIGLNKAHKIQPSPRPRKFHGMFNNADTSVDPSSGSDIVRNSQLSALASSIPGKNIMVSEKKKDLAPVGHLLKRNKHLHRLFLSDDINNIKGVNNHDIHVSSRASISSSPEIQPLSQPELLVKPNVPVKELSESFHEKVSQTFSTDTDNTITDAFSSLHSGIAFSNISTAASAEPIGAVNENIDDWNLSMVSILSTSDKEPQQQAVTSAGWSGEEIGAVLIITIMVPFILFSNLLVILSIARFKRLQIPTNYFITSLASVDVLVALATPFMIMVEVFQLGSNGGDSGALLCLLPNRILMMTCGVSLLTLATIAYDRHTALVSPLDYVVIMTSRRVGLLVLLAWIYSALVVWFPLVAGWHDCPTQMAQCSADLLHGKAHALFLSAIFLPSCVVILVCYTRIFSLAHHHAKAIAAVESAVQRRLQVKFMIKDAKYAKTLALVIGVFLTLWLPYLVSTFVKLVASVTLGIWVQTYLMLVAVLNSGINPWIYAYKNKEFRHAFSRLYHEVLLEHLCLRRFGRKMSFAHTTGCNSTPRLSITDSRMGIGAGESATLDNVCEKLKRSMDSLDRFEKYYDSQISDRFRDWSESLPVSCRQMTTKMRIYRQALSCSDLHSTEELTAILPRSLSAEVLSNVGENTLNDSTQGDDQSDTNPYQLNRELLSTDQSDNAQSYLPVEHVGSLACLTTHSTIGVPLTSTHLISSSLSKKHQISVHRFKEHKTLSLSPLPTKTFNMQSSSISHIPNSKKLTIAPKVTDSVETMCKEAVCFVNELTPVSSHKRSGTPPSLNFLSVTDSPKPQTPSLGRFSRTGFCRGFYPEPKSLSCTLELRVP
ncbi:hypothetical protein EGW08_016997 [Elysia chlorotica]|uniref:G-protein coupled receptors family 1 profile domain-containing protein n=1 Tax=Elysia chlorotica TaxID=188477 RepID=A0A3S1HA46_ELYCH|nr:hypothetical protein EGW08_016997 [Elysia chlorotica]